jgi:hypothetical protein
MNDFIPGGFSNYGELITTSSPYKNFKIINTGWREDQSLKKIKNNVLKKLEETEFTYLESGNLRIKIFKSNIQEYFSQQILICFGYE